VFLFYSPLKGKPVIQLWSSRLAFYIAATTFLFMLALGLSGTIAASSLPAGWTCTGSCGSSGADGVVPLSPAGNSAYEWISTNGGILGVGALAGVSGPDGRGTATNGSTLQTNIFSASTGSLLNFNFDYTTSDGGGVSDYAWAELLNSANVPVALLATARTTPGGNTIPGSNMPVPTGTLNPSTATIQPGLTTWSPLGSSSGACFIGPALGCGTTGWVSSSFTIDAAGNYFLLFGVTNWNDQFFDSGLAIDGVTVDGEPITARTPEPASLLLLGIGAVPLLLKRRRS
jgi:hypothetical protein